MAEEPYPITCHSILRFASRATESCMTKWLIKHPELIPSWSAHKASTILMLNSQSRFQVLGNELRTQLLDGQGQRPFSTKLFESGDHRLHLRAQISLRDLRVVADLNIFILHKNQSGKPDTYSMQIVRGSRFTSSEFNDTDPGKREVGEAIAATVVAWLFPPGIEIEFESENVESCTIWSDLRCSEGVRDLLLHHWANDENASSIMFYAFKVYFSLSAQGYKNSGFRKYRQALVYGMLPVLQRAGCVIHNNLLRLSHETVSDALPPPRSSRIKAPAEFYDADLAMGRKVDTEAGGGGKRGRENKRKTDTKEGGVGGGKRGRKSEVPDKATSTEKMAPQHTFAKSPSLVMAAAMQTAVAAVAVVQGSPTVEPGEFPGEETMSNGVSNIEGGSQGGDDLFDTAGKIQLGVSQREDDIFNIGGGEDPDWMDTFYSSEKIPSRENSFDQQKDYVTTTEDATPFLSSPEWDATISYDETENLLTT